ncbi:alpha/beta hydrolase family protein [Lacrimispora sp.]|uniref:alpha/beta hydrolase family protein n=1 Tax=Lacrimispora sp. TaxID=2719234 RepID=UPI0028574CDB|nr:alpha/beta fold hydrolase [Lacrimispora sp.]MDR7812370.1 alpha/beta fold hydrolase [Lacrimispora sp.]
MLEEKIVIGAGTKYPLNGILSIPAETNGLFPAVVLVHGSGPLNMDEKVGNNYPFKDLAEGLTKKGIAVLRYDKRTFIYGKEMRNHPELTVKEETIEDAILATALLRNDSRIDSERIFIIGHSMGGMLSPRIDAEGGNFAGLIIMGGTTRKLEEVIIEQNNEVLKSLNRFLQVIVRKQIVKLSSKFDNIYNMSDDEARSTLVLGKYCRAYYLKEMGEHPLVHYLESLNKPMLILQGDKDFHVSIEKDFNQYKELLKEKQNVTFKIYHNLNHLFMPSIYGKIQKAKKEYKVAQHIDEQVINDISDWILSAVVSNPEM